MEQTKTFQKNLTKPKSPVFHTDKRMKLKDEFLIASADKALESSHEFKARSLNKKILEQPTFVPKIEKKS